MCIISHGSSSPQAVHNAVQLAQDVVLADTVGALTAMAAKASPSNSMGSGED